MGLGFIDNEHTCPHENGGKRVCTFPPIISKIVNFAEFWKPCCNLNFCAGQLVKHKTSTDTKNILAAASHNLEIENKATDFK